MSCEKEHSWAWIDPQGKFIEVHHHGAWALKNFPSEALDRALDKASHLQDAEPAPGVFRMMMRAVVENYGNIDDAPGVLAGIVYKVPDEVRVLAERLRLPTLSKGVYPLKTKLTRAEERLLADLGVYPERVRVEKDSRWNRRLRAYWSEYSGQMYTALMDGARAALLDRGWAIVSNAYAIGSNVPLKSVQWETFFREVLACWKAEGLRPRVDVEQIHVAERDAVTNYKWSEVLDVYASRRTQDAFYEHLLEGSPSALKLLRDDLRREQEWSDYLKANPVIEKKPPVPVQRVRPAPLRMERYPNRSQRRASLLIQAWGKVL